jgi:DNA-binding MarR family transcriptional regulator/GNAT superfamily N-acetyltransferase
MDYLNSIGKMAIGSRVRLLGEKISAEAQEIYRAYETELQPKWFPVFYALTKGHGESGTAIAELIGHSHASVSKIVAEMVKAGIITEKRDKTDKRRTLLQLTKKGSEIAERIESQYVDVTAAIEELSKQATHNLWEALGEWDYLLNQESLKDRVLKQKKLRESADVVIEDYQPKYAKVFRDLNEQWITTYFGKLEKPDIEALSNPKKYILDRGGFIFVALLNGRPVGVCALVERRDLGKYELVKMAVSPEARGKNVGFLLGQAVVQKAKALKLKSIYLESNTILVPAINLYRKLGFKKVAGLPTPYERCNIQMELELSR